MGENEKITNNLPVVIRRFIKAWSERFLYWSDCFCVVFVFAPGVSFEIFVFISFFKNLWTPYLSGLRIIIFFFLRFSDF